jgi:V8-like Glu-specific endopeptidase
MTFLTRVSISASALLMLSTSVSYAQDKSVILVNPDAKAATSYWTPERFKTARPLPMPQATPNAVLPQEQPRADVQVQSSNAHAPALNVRPAAKTLFTPDATQHQDSVVASPNAVGTFGAHYTSTRVFPLFTGTSAGFSADRAYPYITVGKLFFSIDGTPYVCSASVIQHRIVATAGHCVHSGTTGGFYSNWVFVPAFREGTAPLLSWNWRSVIVTGAWAGGGGAVPNAADYAMIEFADQPVGNSRAVALGDLTGWLGWQTLSLAANHTSKLGYPCNLDSCQKMQDVTSSALRTVAPNNVEYGSDATGGSSGGPWVQNFQVTQVGGGTGLNTGSNRVVGVTSYGYVSADPKVQGASIPDSRWVDLFNTLCARVAGNCL